MQKTKFSKIKNGEYFMFPNKKKVYTYNGKVRMYYKRGYYKGWGYSYSSVDDVNDYKETITDRDIIIGFEY